MAQIKNKFWYPVFYMFVVTSLFSAVVIGFAQITADRVQANQQIAFEKAVLSVLPVDLSELKSDLAIHNYFTENVEQPSKETGGAYVIRKNGEVIAYALTMEGQGFWAPIKAVIGIEADQKTITGFYVYQQNETPGLGAEITQESFINQFDEIVIAEGPKSINFKRPSESLEPSEVHAVTGATQTSTRLEKIINDALIQWRVKMKNR
ncbi:MAG: FMN-binding protein [Phycisphaerae bacterium]